MCTACYKQPLKPNAKRTTCFANSASLFIIFQVCIGLCLWVAEYVPVCVCVCVWESESSVRRVRDFVCGVYAFFANTLLKWKSLQSVSDFWYTTYGRRFARNVFWIARVFRFSFNISFYLNSVFIISMSLYFIFNSTLAIIFMLKSQWNWTPGAEFSVFQPTIGFSDLWIKIY